MENHTLVSLSVRKYCMYINVWRNAYCFSSKFAWINRCAAAAASILVAGLCPSVIVLISAAIRFVVVAVV